jgi:hypothetical protein
VRDEVSEAALAHTDPNTIRAAYRRSTLLDEKRIVMQAWTDFAEGRASDPEVKPASCPDISIGRLMCETSALATLTAQISA